jgi:hypothetical protein
MTSVRKDMCSEVIGDKGFVRHCQKQNFLSNPLRIHSEEEDEEKEE